MTYSHNRTASGRHPERFHAHGTNSSAAASSTNSHQHHSNSITYASNSSPTNGGIGGGGGGFFTSNRKTNQHHHHRSSHGGWQRTSAANSTSSRCAGGNNLLPSSTTNGGNGGGSGNGNATRTRKTTGHHFNNNNQNRTNAIQVLIGGTGRGLSPTLPTNLTHFAGSKCFDAPAPTALPKPPQHWTTSLGANTTNVRSPTSTPAVLTSTKAAKSSRRSLLDDFDTHNLKLLLNVQS